MPILLPYSTDIPPIWFDEPPKVVPEDVLVPGIAPPPGDPAPLMIPIAPTTPDRPSAAPAQEVTPVVLTVAVAEPEPVEPAGEPLAVPAQTPIVIAAGSVAAEAASPPTAASAPMEVASSLAPAFDVPPEDAFPTLADLDAILAANAGAPPEPTAEERAEVIDLLGLDPAIANDPLRYAEALANLPEPDADQALEQWMRDYDVGALPSEVPDPAGDWQIG
ncbi:hypothetical protein KPL78_15095 [Roseomonas sp. HJA6]|uniref:DUF3300 domain-containing protein n=1 Tax=Roseomonas alba TaxID=2846776 RepID=A0ABS7AA74_9PROT|nr:hypothetical protein [Neoroseomonas alba]MBW6399187.1 hypothetical protein [Neoroseomonas alba]